MEIDCTVLEANAHYAIPHCTQVWDCPKHLKTNLHMVKEIYLQL